MWRIFKLILGFKELREGLLYNCFFFFFGGKFEILLNLKPGTIDYNRGCEKSGIVV